MIYIGMILQHHICSTKYDLKQHSMTKQGHGNDLLYRFQLSLSFSIEDATAGQCSRFASVHSLVQPSCKKAIEAKSFQLRLIQRHNFVLSIFEDE